MKHLINKNLFQGGGKDKPKPQPPILKPPKLGQYKILSSYSVAEIIDLISDGPVEGLVNQDGYALGNGAGILQGVYLDNTPVETTSPIKNSPLNLTDIIGKVNIFPILKNLKDIYYEEDNKFKWHGVPDADARFNPSEFDARLLITKYAWAKDEYRKGYFFSPLTLNKLGSPSYTNWEYTGEVYPYNNGRYNYYLDFKGLPGYFRVKYTSDMEIHFRELYENIFLYGSVLGNLQNELKAANTTGNVESRIKIANNLIKKIDQFQDRLRYEAEFSFAKKNKIFIVIKIESMQLEPGGAATSINALKANGELEDFYFELTNFDGNIPRDKVHKFVFPEVNGQDQYTGKVKGCIIIEDDSDSTLYTTNRSKGIDFLATISNEDFLNFYAKQYLSSVLNLFTKTDTELFFKKGVETYSPSTAIGPSKYNFQNISCQFKEGDEFQTPLSDFKNLYVDYDYNSQLYGPFRIGLSPRRITTNWDYNGANNPYLSIPLNELDGSSDIRYPTNNAVNYSDWNDGNQYDEVAVPVVHTIENPNVNSVFFTLGISALSDTWHGGSAPNREAGDKLPTIVEIEVEWGKIAKGVAIDKNTRQYAIAAIVEGQMLIDFGSPDLEKTQADGHLSSVREISNGNLATEAVLSKPFELPKINPDEDSSIVKRYIKIKKLSAETNSVLLKKELGLIKVTEIITQNFSYPFSSLVGLKLDSRTFGTIPERSYDCRLKRVKIPSNYKPLGINGLDKRYIKSEKEYTTPNLIYEGDWDGSFIEGWTDNPAWVIYDLLTSKRYGLGSYVDEEQINKWELYKIGRFCDAVDDKGYFEGVSDGVGGLEPRYSCNIVFREQTKIFDAINIVASLFRGSVFFSNSEIHFLDDRPRDPIAIFTNSNVKDGVFNYINNRKDQQFNTVEVAYLDRFDNFQTKIEYVQDEADIRKRGIFKTDINTLGVTSRAMARRIGQHLIYQTVKENQSVEFKAGLESLLCRPGDLIIIEDEMKTRSTNYGRILSKDLNERSLTIDNFYDTESFTGKVTVYSPTGYATSEDLKEIANAYRTRVPYFDVTGNLIDSSDGILKGRYYFSKYTPGYPTGLDENPLGLPSQFPFYTGKTQTNQKIFCYYNTGATGFVFSVGEAYRDNNTYDKVICDTGSYTVPHFPIGIDSTGYRYNASLANKRSATAGKINDKFLVEFNSYKGILDSEISTVNNPQITTFNVFNHIPYDYGAKLFLDPNDININLLPLVSEGSIYRIQRKSATDQIYKIIGIREENQNEYSVYCSKYDTGKFKEIENHITSDYLPETFTTANPVVNGQEIIQLQSPTITNFTSGSLNISGFTLSGSWNSVNSANGYSVSFENLQTRDLITETVSSSTYSFETDLLSAMGYWEMRVSAIAQSPNIDSNISQSGGRFIYNNDSPINKVITNNISLS